MIPLETEIRTWELLRRGCSLTKTAKMAGISKDTVASIRDNGGPRERKVPRHLGPYRKLRNKRRCNQCGAMVSMWPCFFCTHSTHVRDDNPPRKPLFPEGPWYTGQGHAHIIAMTSPSGTANNSVITCGVPSNSPVWPWRTPREQNTITRLVRECPELYDLASDLVELNKLKLVFNPLFRDLVNRAERSLKRINGGNTHG